MDGNFDVFRKVYEQCRGPIPRCLAENAKIEIQTAIRTAKEKKKPVYLVVANDLVTKPIKVWTEPIAPPRPTSNPNTLQAAVNHVRLLLERSHRPVILVDVKTMRFGLQTATRQLADAMNVPVVTMMYGKGGFDENHPNYIGMYLGSFGRTEVQSTVENADCIIAIGMVWAVQHRKFYRKANPLITVNIQPDIVQIAKAEYPNVLAADMLLAVQKVKIIKGKGLTKKCHSLMSNSQLLPDGPLMADGYYPRFKRI